MEEQQRIQHLMYEKNGNGKYTQPLLPIYTPPFQENKTNEWDLRQFATVIRRRAVVFGSVAIAISAVVWGWTLTRQARYEGQFRLLVEPVTTDDSKNKLEGLTQITGSATNLQEDGLDYDSQIEVLRSPKLMIPIIKQLSTRYPEINYNSLLKNLRIKRFLETKVLEVSYEDPDPEKIQFVLQQLSKEFLKYSLQERQTNLRQGTRFVSSQQPQLQSRVNSLQRDMQKFRQQYDFIDPGVRAEQLIGQVSTIKLQRLNIQQQLAEARALYATLKSPSGIKLAKSGALYANPLHSSGSTAAETTSNVTSPSASDRELAETTSNATSPDRAEVKRAEVSGSNATSLERPGTKEALNETSVYERLVAQLRDVESQIAADLTRFQEDSPSIQALKQKRENLLPVLRQEAKRGLENKLVEVGSQISSLEVQEAKIAQAENRLNQQIKQLPTLARKYTDLQRELKVATDSLNRFLEKRESLQIEIAQKEVPWQMIASPQVPEVPISPNVPRNLMLGAIAGIVAGMGAALLREQLDKVFHSPEELKEVTKLPLLGVIPLQKHLKQLTPAADVTIETRADGSRALTPNTRNAQGYSYFPFVEAFRSLHTNISFLGSDTPMHSLVISSALHAEGKSTVSLNLAQAAAAMGQRVLLVDADLRLPQIHTLLRLPNEQGLSNVISSNLSVSEAIQRSPDWDNLFVLTSGQIPPDPTKLLSSKKMQNIMEQLRQEFDLVIYDTPPILGLADSNLLATHTAGIVLVVRIGKTDRSVLLQTLDQLKISRAAILGLVINGVENYNQSAYSYYYYRPQTVGVN